MSNPNKNISICVLKTFLSGDADEWYNLFKICCKANYWNAATKATKLSMLHIKRKSTGSLAQIDS